MDSTLFKRCSICGQNLSVEEFHRRPDRPGQFISGCKSCKSARQREKNAARAVPKQIPLPPTEKPCTRCKVTKPIGDFEPRGDAPHRWRSECRECRRATTLQYKERNREHIRTSAKQYYQDNKEAVGERIRQSIAKNPEKYREIHSSWKKRNKGAVTASGHRRRARILSNGGDWHQDDWERLKAQFDWSCLMCGKQEMTDGITLCFDHVIPISMGGWNIISNAQPLCRSCNSKKHKKVLDLRK